VNENNKSNNLSLSYFYFSFFSEPGELVEDGMYFEYQAIPHLSSTPDIDTAFEKIPNTESRVSKGFQARVVSDIIGFGTGLHKSQKTSTLCTLWSC